MKDELRTVYLIALMMICVLVMKGMGETGMPVWLQLIPAMILAALVRVLILRFRKP